MLGANLVCFQTYSYSRHFASSCIRVCGYESAQGGIDVAGSVCSILHCAVGVDAERSGRDMYVENLVGRMRVLKLYLTAFDRAYFPKYRPSANSTRARKSSSVATSSTSSRVSYKKCVFSFSLLHLQKKTDTLQLKAFERLLRDYPQWRGNVVLIQVTSPSLTDAPKLERQVSELVAKINGEYGSLDFIPVHHYHQTIKKDDFYSLLSVADLALITPLRDGMNTTSMEFVICQQRTNKSPIVLSEFMGISHTMSEALQINPWSLGVSFLFPSLPRSRPSLTGFAVGCRGGD